MQTIASVNSPSLAPFCQSWPVLLIHTWNPPHQPMCVFCLLCQFSSEKQVGIQYSTSEPETDIKHGFDARFQGHTLPILFPPHTHTHLKLQIFSCENALGDYPPYLSNGVSITEPYDWLSYRSDTHRGKDSLLSPADSSAVIPNAAPASVCGID